jgi:hypothetical protein
VLPASADFPGFHLEHGGTLQTFKAQMSQKCCQLPKQAAAQDTDTLKVYDNL